MKKIISLLLSILLVISCALSTASAYSVTDSGVPTVDEAVKQHEALSGEKVETNRYYFLMPNGHNGERDEDGEFESTWYNDYATTAGIYWWSMGVADPQTWCGYLPSGVDENDSDVYYADVPKAVTTIIWNNGVDGGMDNTLPIYYKSAQTCNIGAEYYDPGESDNYPNGIKSFDNMIYVIHPGLISASEMTCEGEWYYYYGNGCYGFTEGGSSSYCLRDDHFDANGNHIEKQETPTQDSTQEPTVVPQGPIAKIEIEPVTLTGGLEGYRTKEHDWSTNEDHFYFCYLPEGEMEYTITFTDGTVIKDIGAYVYYNGEYHRFEVETGQTYKTPWIDGNSYTMTVSLFGVSVDVPVTIKENPVENIEFEPVTIMEGMDGIFMTELEWETDLEYKYYHYTPERHLDYTITWKDGRVTEEHGQHILYDGEFLLVDEYTDQSYKTQWSGGNTYTMKVSLFGFSADVPVTLLENPIDRIEIKPITISERTHGHVNTYYDPYKMEKYEYYYYNPEDVMEYTIYLKDGTCVSGVGSDSEFEYNGEKYWFSIDTDQSYENQWTVGNTYAMTATLMGITVEVPVTIEKRTEFVLGDADLDGELSVLDASLIQLYLVGKKDIDGTAVLAADTDEDGEISVLDASLIQLKLVGKK